MSLRTILVTGASAGIGAAVARHFVAGGHQVLGTARRSERLAELEVELAPFFTGIELDLRDADLVRQRISAIAKEKPIDVLVNCAGLALGMETADMAIWNDWEQMVATNISGLLAVTHSVLPSMKARGVGHVINLGSVAGSYPYRAGNVYGATKAFIRQFSLNLRADVAGTAIRVTDIQPGMVGGTEFFETRSRVMAPRRLVSCSRSRRSPPKMSHGPSPGSRGCPPTSM